MIDSLDGDCHAVVFDVNVYLDVAELVGPPFTWQAFNALAISHKDSPLPNSDQRVDSLRAIAVSMSGKFVGPQPLEIWTSDHIDVLVELKAGQPRAADTAEGRGLGWSVADARGLLAGFVDDLVYDMTNGGTVGEITRADGTPPLSHEDGCVYTTARCAAPDEEEYYHRYLVTCDRHIRESAPELASDVEIYHPHEWVELLRNVRKTVGLRAMRQFGDPGQR